ncbi:MAG: hypothetical protein U1E74_08110 [Paenacidovorax caeni]
MLGAEHTAKKSATARLAAPAHGYLPQWLDLQLGYRQPGCSVAIARAGKTVAELALGVADMRTHKHY